MVHDVLLPQFASKLPEANLVSFVRLVRNCVDRKATQKSVAFQLCLAGNERCLRLTRSVLLCVSTHKSACSVVGNPNSFDDDVRVNLFNAAAGSVAPGGTAAKSFED